MNAIHFIFVHAVAKAERPLFSGYSAAWEPPTCSYLSPRAQTNCQATFFGQPLTKGF